MKHILFQTCVGLLNNLIPIGHMDISWNDLRPEDLPGDLQEIAKDCGMEVAQYLVECWGGATLYVPTLCRMRKERRDRLILKEHNGHNEGALASRYGISRRYVHNIIKAHEAES